MKGHAQIYIDHSRERASEQFHIPAMGLHEVMPRGMIRHGGKGSRHPCLLMYFHSAARSLAPNGNGWLAAGNRLVVWPYEAFHQYGNLERRWDHSWLRVTGRWIDGVLRHTSVPLGIPIDLGDASEPLRFWQLISDELRGRVRQDSEMLRGLMQVLWHDIERRVSAGAHGRHHDPRLERARQFIEERFDRPFRLSDAAQQANLSPSHFCSSFSKQFGAPPREYAMRLRLQRGAQLLANRELAVFQVAEMVGCADALYFSRLFQRRYGLSPTAFRQGDAKVASAFAR